jgi:putative transposase
MQLQNTFPVQRVCRALRLAPSTFYYHSTVVEDVRLRDEIERIALEFPRFGYRRMTAELQRRDWRVNHKRILRVMRENHLLVEVKRYCRTTWSDHTYGRYPNLVKDLAIVRPDQVWAADITYIQVQREFLYLAVLMDLFTRAIRGWELSRSLSEELTLTALRRALQTHQPEIHHSDQGVQYAATRYTGCLQRGGILISMTAQGQPTENAFAERLMRTLKEEEVYLHEYQDYQDARTRMARFLDEVYMHKRLHSALGYVPPSEFEANYRLRHTVTLNA